MKLNCTILLSVLVGISSLTAAEPRGSQRDSETQPAPVVDFFQAIDRCQIEVRFIPLGADAANVLIANKTDQVLHLRLPDAFAAVPVLSQINGGFGQGVGLGQGGGGGAASQGVGGGINGGGNQGFGNQGFGNGLNGGGRQQGGIGMGFMRIAPEATSKLKATTVCLEFGKAEPNPRIRYQMIPLEQFTDNQEISELCQAIGRGTIHQRTAQAAAWHLADGLPWHRLSDLNRIESRYLGNIKYFNESDLAEAKKWIASIRTVATSSLESGL